ncbi:DNA/RNA non-specific endonuclease [Burkholderia plantarii]|uniref:DNA/RNA non-specific endonuclease n=1 Tax=Burkholderia plantarii TaxID=41899 RepID=UPI00272C21DD|nr:DNA/RNA non-specific endonuclease [Burkholderia plantarii]
MVADRVQSASVAKNGVPSSTDLLTQQAIAAVNGQVLQGAIGGVGSGFMPLDTSYNGNVGLFGGVGGAMTTLDAVTSNAAVDALAAYRAPYSAATLLSGLGMGIPAAPTPLAGEPFETSFAEPRPGVQVAGYVWPSFGGSHARTDEAELTGATGRKDWTSQSKTELFFQGVANGLGALNWGGGRVPPASPGLILVGSLAMGLAKVAAGLVPTNALFNSGNESPSSSQSGSGGRTEVKNGYIYELDSSGRATNIKGTLELNPSQGRDAKAQLEAGGADRLGTDEGGHYIGRRFNGPMDDFNHFAQNMNFNRGSCKALENSWQRAINVGSSVYVDITPKYSGGSLRADPLIVIYSVDEVPYQKSFMNRLGGQ